MELVIDGRTMTVRWPSGVPVTDVSLVLGDTVPVRIRVDHALTDCTPALAVKQTIGSADLVMTVTAFTRQDDWQEASWVVNTVPLQEAPEPTLSENIIKLQIIDNHILSTMQSKSKSF